ncbi:MAG: hypothetical protein CMF59_08235 [Leptospiraceae bacterium]|nr:hypothetical protein [Leptospiraceae bacterium]
MNYKKLASFTFVAGSFLALMAAGPGAAIFPRSLLLASDLYCPEPARADVETRNYAYGTTRGYTVHVSCHGADGSRRDVGAFTAFLSLFAIYLIPGLVLAFIPSFLLLRWAGRTFGSQSNSVADLVSGLKKQGYSNVQVQSRSYSSDNLPENIEEFIRSATSGGAPGSTQKQQDLSARLSELQEAQKAGLISDEEYEAKRKEILDEF